MKQKYPLTVFLWIQAQRWLWCFTYRKRQAHRFRGTLTVHAHRYRNINWHWDRQDQDFRQDVIYEKEKIKVCLWPRKSFNLSNDNVENEIITWQVFICECWININRRRYIQQLWKSVAMSSKDKVLYTGYKLTDDYRAEISLSWKHYKIFTRLCLNVDCLRFTGDPLVLHQRSTEQSLVLQNFGARGRMRLHCICLNTYLNDRQMTKKRIKTQNTTSEQIIFKTTNWLLLG